MRWMHCDETLTFILPSPSLPNHLPPISKVMHANGKAASLLGNVSAAHLGVHSEDQVGAAPVHAKGQRMATLMIMATLMCALMFALMATLMSALMFALMATLMATLLARCGPSASWT